MKPAAFLEVRWILWVRHEELAEHIALGWVNTGPLPGPHGFWSCGVEWPFDSPPVFPKKEVNHAPHGD